MNIVVGCPVKNRGWCLSSWFDAIQSQGIDVEIMCLYSESNDDTLEILETRGAWVIHDELPGRNDIDVEGHYWGRLEDFVYMAEIRNLLLERVMEKFSPTLYLSLDSDILIPPGALQQMLDIYEQHRPGVLSPYVNMGIQTISPNVMTWNDRYNPFSAHRPGYPPISGYHDVVMAVMMLDFKGMKARWAAHPQGEDVGYCLDAKNQGIGMWWESSIRCDHLMIRQAR